MLKLPQPINDAIYLLGCVVITISITRGLEGIAATAVIFAIAAAFSVGIRAVWARLNVR
jgi:hypothetical protein